MGDWDDQCEDELDTDLYYGEAQTCPRCYGYGYYRQDGQPVHCSCGSYCPSSCPACAMEQMERAEAEMVRMIHWFKPFGRLLIWSQHDGLRAHAFFYNGQRAMYVVGVNFRPFRVYAGKAW